MRNRKQPKWYSEPWKNRFTGIGKYNKRIAEQAVQKEFTVVGISHRFKNEINWEYNPTTALKTKYAHDPEWTWQFSRMNWWHHLGRAYHATGNEKYTHTFVDQMSHWVRSNPVPATMQNVPFSRWRTIECGIRMAGSWPASFFMFLKSPSFTDEALCLMLSSFLDHARYLHKFNRLGNWLTMEMNGLFHIGILFPEFKQAPVWRAYAVKKMLKELDIQVYPDGAQVELTPGYHIVALNNFAGLLDIAQLNRVPFPKAYKKKLERMFDFTMRLTTPARDNPPLNDSWPVDVPRVMQKGHGYFPRRKDFQWFATNGRAGKAPKDTSLALKNAGYLVMRSSWKKDAHYCVFDVGPYSLAHQHEDKLSFEVYSFGRRLVADCGSYAYDASAWRQYVLSHQGHNVVSIDGQQQNRRGVNSTCLAWKPYPFTWKSTARYDFAVGSYGQRADEGFGPRRIRLAVHTRAILFIKNEFFVVIDAFKPPDKKIHRYDAIFHLDVPRPSDAVMDDKTLTVRTRLKNTPNITILAASTQALKGKIVAAQTKPFIQGWMPLGHGIRGVRPLPVPTYTIQGRGRQYMVYAFYPTRPGRPCRIASLELASGQAETVLQLCLRFNDGRVGTATFNSMEFRIDYRETTLKGKAKRKIII